MRSLLVVYCVVVLALLLWPYRFVAPCKNCSNGASWLANRIEFRTPGLVRSASPPIGLYQALISGDGLAVEVWLTTATLDQTGPARIVSYSRDPRHRNFTLGQQNADLVFRLRTTETDLNGTRPEITVPEAFVPGKKQHIVISYDFAYCRVYVDGQLRDSVAGPGGSFSNWDPDYRLLFGNEQTGDRPWTGSISGVALYDRPMSADDVAARYSSGDTAAGADSAVFDFSRADATISRGAGKAQAVIDLELPYSFTNQGTPDVVALTPRNVADVISNFAIFLPFGALLFFNLSDHFGSVFRAAAATFCLTVVFSLIAESLQYYVAARTSSLLDCASAVAGGVAGGGVAAAWQQLFQPS